MGNRYQQFASGWCNESYHFVCFRFSACKTHRSGWGKRFNQPIVEGGYKVKSTHMPRLLKCSYRIISPYPCLNMCWINTQGKMNVKSRSDIDYRYDCKKDEHSFFWWHERCSLQRSTCLKMNFRSRIRMNDVGNPYCKFDFSPNTFSCP